MKKTIVESAKGFTLIELLIVVAIIGILAAVAIPNYMRARDKARFGACRETLSGVRTAQEVVMTDNETYTSDQTLIAREMIGGDKTDAEKLTAFTTRVSNTCNGFSVSGDTATFCIQGDAKNKGIAGNPTHICVGPQGITPDKIEDGATDCTCSLVQ